jgi:NAD(P)-dependent dehydrogenase (short-subunit alcohol dehydrogenase family)
MTGEDIAAESREQPDAKHSRPGRPQSGNKAKARTQRHHWRKIADQRFEDEDRRNALDDPSIRALERDLQQIQVALNATRERFGRLDLLFNNAGLPASPFRTDTWEPTAN